ncbi:MAG: M16 family metallopeptidase, partial [Planctomycetaceae bacterium]
MTAIRFAAILLLLSGPAAALSASEPKITPQHRAAAGVDYESRQYLGKGVTQAQLSNGLTVLVQENHAAPVVTVRCYVTNTGSAFEGEYLGAGISHLLEHLVASGTTSTRTEDEIEAIVDSLGGQTNAYTSNDVTAFYIDAPASKVNVAIELIADGMQSSAIPNTEYLREMGVVQRELEMGESERDRVRYQAMKQLVFTEHPMRHPIIGYLPVLQRITRDDVLRFYHSRYVPQNMTFVVVGDVETGAVLAEVRKRFERFHRTTERSPVLGDEPQQASPRSTRIVMAGETAELSLAWPTVPLQHPDLYPLDVASYILTGGDSARLTQRMTIDQPLAVEVDSASYTPWFVKGWFQLTAECTPDNFEKCREILLEEIRRLQSEPAGEEELAKVKRQVAANHVFNQQTVQN